MRELSCSLHLQTCVWQHDLSYWAQQLVFVDMLSV